MGIAQIRLNPMIDGRFYRSYQLEVISMKVLIIMVIVLFAAAIIKIGESV